MITSLLVYLLCGAVAGILAGLLGVGGNDDRAGLRAFQHVDEFLAAEERQLFRFGVLEGADAGNRLFGVALEFALDEVGDEFGVHDHVRGPFRRICYWLAFARRSVTACS